MKKKRLPNEASIFSAEICVINMALKLVSTSNKEKFIHSDSISFLEFLKNTKTDNPFIIKLLNKLNSMNHGKKVMFCWISSHIGILGKDKADSLAETALNMAPDKKIKDTVYWPQTENQANNYKEMATILEEKSPQQVLPSKAYFKRKEEKKPVLPGSALDIQD